MYSVFELEIPLIFLYFAKGTKVKNFLRYNCHEGTVGSKKEADSNTIFWYLPSYEYFSFHLSILVTAAASVSVPRRRQHVQDLVLILVLVFVLLLDGDSPQAEPVAVVPVVRLKKNKKINGSFR